MMNIKRIQHIQRIKHRATYETKSLASLVLFNTHKHTYTIGDMITLISFMTLLCGFAYVSLVIGIK